MYWDIDSDDVRLVTLQRLVKTVDPRALGSASTEEIVALCIDALKRFEISEELRASLHRGILAQNSRMQDAWVEHIAQELAGLNAAAITIVSLGCGDESVFERGIAEEMAKKYPAIKLEWLGVDVADFRSPTSFLKDQPFKIIDPDADINYRSLVETSNPMVLIGRWSYHHLDIAFDEFLKRCEGMSKVILVEEPASAERWAQPEYRVMRIAYDLLGNEIMSRSWAAAFKEDPKKFKIRYVTPESLPPKAKVQNFPAMLPETALIVL